MSDEKDKNVAQERSTAEQVEEVPPPDEAATPTPEAEIAALRQQLQEEQAKAAEIHDQWLRSVAELRNYKKRVEQEREQMAREAHAGLVTHMLPILDDLERALAALPDEKMRHFSWVEGIVLIYRRLQAVLEQHGLRPIAAVGQPFDPYLHEAILFEEVPAEQDQVVLSELQKGYKLHERVLRPTLVKVGRAAPTPSQEGPAEAVPSDEPPTETPTV